MVGDDPGVSGLLISDFAGMGRRAPHPGRGLTMFLVCFGGIPPLAGFWGKFFIFSAAIDRGGPLASWLAVAMVVNSVISLVYYISIVRAMWLDPIAEPVRPLRIPPLAVAIAGLSALAIIAVGVYPDLFAHFPPLSTLVSP